MNIAVVAMDEKRGIGKDNKVPWHIKEDLIRLKNLTKDEVVILGRKTFESMVWYYDKSGKDMPGKQYIVVTRNNDFKINRKNVLIANSLNDAISKAKGKDTYIIGGGQIFNEAMEQGLINKLYLTIVKGDYNADTFFPEYSNFKLTEDEQREEGEHRFRFQTLIST